MFADNAKMSKTIKNKNDLWLVSLNVDKCLAMFINKDNTENNNNYTIKEKI